MIPIQDVLLHGAESVTQSLLGTSGILSESKHGDASLKQMRKYGLPIEGLNHEHIVRGIANTHGIPPALVPQVLHHFGATYTQRSERTNSATTNDPTGSKYKTGVGNVLKMYAGAGKDGGGLDAFDTSSVSGQAGYTHDDLENAADHAKNWHALATSPKKEEALKYALHRSQYGGQEDVHQWLGDPENKKEADTLSKRAHDREDSAKGSGTDAEDQQEAHTHLMHAAKNYNPLADKTYSPTAKEHVPTALFNSDTPYHHIHLASQYLNAIKGHKIPFKPDAEHVDDKGVKYHGYSLHTPEKANDRCWGSKFCLATPGHAEHMNKMYHGGQYKTTHIITRVGEHGEHIHAAFSPEMLPKQAHANPEQAVRNSGNNGAIKGEEFKRIHPLLSKLDYRADNPDTIHHYTKDEG